MVAKDYFMEQSIRYAQYADQYTELFTKFEQGESSIEVGVTIRDLNTGKLMRVVRVGGEIQSTSTGDFEALCLIDHKTTKLFNYMRDDWEVLI